MLLGWYANAYSFAGVTLFLTLVPHGHLLSWPTANGTFALPPRRNDGSSRVRGRALLSFRLVPGMRQRSLLSLQIETCAPFNSCLARCPLSLDFSCFTYLSRCSCMSRYCRSANTNIGPACESFFGYSSRLGQGRNNRAIKSDHLKSAPKRLRNLLEPLNRPLPICRDFYLPGVRLNDLAGLRAAIIASCTIRATQELWQSPDPLTFWVRGPGAWIGWITCGLWW
jgi:hypothetical protein